MTYTEMIKEILFKKDLSLKNRLKNVILYVSRKRGAQKSWDKRHNKVLKVNNELKKSCKTEVEYEHQKIWSDFRNKLDFTTLRISKNISGIADPKIVPEDIYVADIEPTLITDKSVDFIGIKSFYNKWFPNGIFPRDLFHKIDGQYFTADLEISDYNELKKISKKLGYPVVLKPNKDTYGGMDINIVHNSDQLLKLAEERINFVIQNKIKQHNFFNQLYPESLNTIKVFLYRSVKDNKLHILSMALRMGKDGSLDNEALGGISSLIKSDGNLNGYAIDKFGNKYLEHPNTGIKFNCQIPDLEKLKTLSLIVGEKIFYTRIFALDTCYDNEGNWRIIEINTYGQSIRFSQYSGKPFFGKFTDEIIEYCKENHWALKI